MKRFLLAWSLLLLGIVCLSQQPRAYWQSRDSNFDSNIPSTGCAEATTYLNASSDPTFNAANTTTMICGMVTDGTFALLDWFYYFPVKTSADALINVKNPGTFNGTWTQNDSSFTASIGFTMGGSGSGAFIDSGFNPSIATSPHCTLNACSIGTYNLTSDTAAAGNFSAGGNDGTNFLALALRYSSSGWWARINNADFNFNTNANAQGNYVAVRTNSTTVITCKNEATCATDTTTSAAVPNVNMYAIGFNNNGSGRNPVGTTDYVITTAWIGGTMDATHQTNMAKRINCALTGLPTPKNVYSSTC